MKTSFLRISSTTIDMTMVMTMVVCCGYVYTKFCNIQNSIVNFEVDRLALQSIHKRSKLTQNYISQIHYPTVTKQVTEWLKNGVISPHNGKAYLNLPLLLIKQFHDDGTFNKHRLCLDFRPRVRAVSFPAGKILKTHFTQ